MSKINNRILLTILGLSMLVMSISFEFRLYITFYISLFFMIYVLYSGLKEITKLKQYAAKLDSNYILKLTFEQFVGYLDAIVLKSLIQAIREDVSEPTRITRQERYKMITDNSVVRYLNYFTDELDFINMVYGTEYIIKHYNFYVDHIISNGDFDKLINRYSKNITYADTNPSA